MTPSKATTKVNTPAAATAPIPAIAAATTATKPTTAATRRADKPRATKADAATDDDDDAPDTRATKADAAADDDDDDDDAPDTRKSKPRATKADAAADDDDDDADAATDTRKSKPRATKANDATADDDTSTRKGETTTKKAKPAPKKAQPAPKKAQPAPKKNEDGPVAVSVARAPPAVNASAGDGAPPAITLRIGPPKGKPRSQHGKPSTAAADGDGNHHIGAPDQGSDTVTTALGQVKSTTTTTRVHRSDESITIAPDHDVVMNSPPRSLPTRAPLPGRQTHSEAGSITSGASRPYGGILRGRALGNAANIGDLNPDNMSPEPIDIEATVNLFVSKERPSSLDVDESAIISVQIPYVEQLAPLLEDVAKCYSPVRRENHRIYILDRQKWVVKGRYNQVIDDLNLRVNWTGSRNGPSVTLFLENETEVASAIPPSFLSRRSVSLQSRSSSSRSVSSRSPSASSGIVTGSLTAPLNENTGPSTLPVPHKEALLTFLEIDTSLPYLGFPAVSVLRACFSKYKELDRVAETMEKLRNNDHWRRHVDQAGLEYWQPTYVDLVNIFVAKSQFYSVWKKHFKRAQKYRDMVEWLDDDPNGLSNEDLWGEEGLSFSFTDLSRWLDRKEAIKGKKKEVASSSKQSGSKEKSGEKNKKKKREKSSEEAESTDVPRKTKGKGKKKATDWLVTCVMALSFVSRSWVVIWLLLWFNLVSLASASQTESFPNISFRAFSQIIESNFGPNISLATVLVLLFTLTENADLLNLHFRQQHPVYSRENNIQISGWIIGLTKALKRRLGNKTSTLFSDDDDEASLSAKDKTNCIATKLDEMAVGLDLTPYNEDNAYTGKLLPISLEEIQPVHVICPSSFVCGTAACKPRSLVQDTRNRDIPLVTLIKDHKIYKNVPVLTGKCPECNTSYSADHERFLHNFHGTKQPKRVYLNSAKYLKIGSNLWADRAFSGSAINAMYSFHASASAYSDYWNNTYGTASLNVGRAHIWQAFVQDSLRTIASESNIDLELDDPLNITEVTTQAYAILGEAGIIRAADQHSCAECTQEYKKSSDAVFQDPAAVVGVDENHAVPPLAENVQENHQRSASPMSEDSLDDTDMMNIDKKFVKMVVLDGIVMGPTHCAIDNCANSLSNSRGGSLSMDLGALFVIVQIFELTTLVHVRHTRESGENTPSIVFAKLSLECAECYSGQEKLSLGIHIEGDQIYNVMMMIVKILHQSESPTNILNFLESVYQTEESRPDYICIDKGCKVLETAVSNGSWDTTWKKTSRFIVDTYHYINHRVTDYLCRKYCNPSPGDGSAPNLVIIAYDDTGRAYAQKAFNTQVCEQLNAWLGGFETILKRMTPGNFNWFLHTMLFYHTKYVIAKQKRKAESQNNGGNDDEDEDLGLDEPESDTSDESDSDSDVSE
ncbi:hypothetical protein BDZ97DRAFT_1759713 [Flammula alnicola]|nr:hypothetical protein BDZ97DRAFT_1759713 [Flammula alnicola]